MNRIFLISILIVISITTYGRRTTGSTKYVQGYIVTLEQDTLYGKIRIKVDNDKKFMPSKVEAKVIFVPEKGKRRTYLPGTISYFYFYYNYETIKYASVPYFNGQLFMKVISEKGFLKLYRYYEDDERGLSTAYKLAEFLYASDFGKVNFFYILKPDGAFLFLGKHTPRNKILSFFIEIPELAKKIKSREYKYTDVYRMVREYNRFMADNQN